MFEKERCWIIYGLRINNTILGLLKYQGSGSWGAVGFNWKKAVSKLLQGFHHTHPDNITEPSGRDDKTMNAWIRSEGKSLILGVKSGKSLKFFLYERSGKREIKYELYGNILFASI